MGVSRERRSRMRLGYFTMPVHPIDRPWAETLQEDREAIILADKLGFYDAFMGEHLTDKAENITNSMIFNASLISDTKQIKLATGTSNLSHMHPVLVAQHAAMFDHLSKGRFIFGVSPGALTSKAEGGVQPDVKDWRGALTIFGADDDKTAERYGRSGAGNPYEFYWSQMLFKMKRGKRAYVFKSHKEQPDDEITIDYVLDNCVIHGSVNKVVDQLLALREEIGDFGEIVYAGMDWADPTLAKRSMQLMAEQVLPRVNAAIGKSAAA